MSTIRELIADIHAAHEWSPDEPYEGWGQCECDGRWLKSSEHHAHVAEVLCSVPGIVVIDTARVDKIAAAIAANWPDTYARPWPWDSIPENARDAYRARARAAVTAAADDAT